jgi:transforming growth factor-beta-induced protein
MKMTTILATVAAGLGMSAAAMAQCSGSKAEEKQAGQMVTAMHTMEMGEKTIVETALANPDFSTLVTALQKAGLVNTLSDKGPFTVFAPTNAAFAKVDPKALAALLADKGALTRVLTSHVVSGTVLAADVTKLTFADTVSGQRFPISTKSGVTIGGANVTATDIKCSNGVIHVIDTVIMPESGNIIDVATKAGKFTTLAKALEAAGLVSTLQSEGPFTVFAPTDEAFAKLPKGTLEDLLKPENREKLKGILTYHVVPGRVFSDQAVKAASAKTVQGQNVTIAVTNGKAMVNNAGLVKTDINASNGVIHVIDTVLLPK